MTPELKRFKAAVLLDRSSAEEQAKRHQKSVRALHRALSEPNFSKTLKAKLIRYTNRILDREGLRRAAA